MFGSVKRIRAMTSTDIASVPGFSAQLAESILAHLTETEKTEKISNNSSIITEDGDV